MDFASVRGKSNLVSFGTVDEWPSDRCAAKAAALARMGRCAHCVERRRDTVKFALCHCRGRWSSTTSPGLWSSQFDSLKISRQFMRAFQSGSGTKSWTKRRIAKRDNRNGSTTTATAKSESSQHRRPTTVPAAGLGYLDPYRSGRPSDRVTE
ncbi:unnamed protein product [Soboliphyme baturini]|uniref:Uncharacterized protein n=1 Tax=Soboliphyme baturini TaxID=241478 RepID=A0A183IQ10_9BILA|nr:unnamed protein product [Soboliphyme baturini]